MLGINFSTDLNKIAEINFENKPYETRKIINRWMKRIITPLGRLAIIKSLLISKLNYLFLLLPNPPEDFMKELKQILFEFLWSGKPDKINRSVACQSIEEGGLGMIDVFEYINALKLKWI